MKAGIFALLLLFGLSTHAQMVRYSTELVPLSADEVEKAKVWNFSGRAVVREDAPNYVIFDEGIFYENFGESCRAYAVAGDSLFFRGYNIGRGERMNVTEGEGFSLLPQDFEQRAAYSAQGRNREGLPTAEGGTVVYSVSGPGRVIIGCDTIRNVSLNRIEFKAVKTVADTVLIVDNNFTVYNWTAPGSAFPLAVQYAAGDEAQLYVRALDGEDFAAEEADVAIDEEAAMSVLEGASVETGSGTVQLRFPAGCEAFDVDVYLLDASGYLYAQRTVNTADDFPCVFETSGLRHGQYIVAVNLSENPALNRKILVVL